MDEEVDYEVDSPLSNLHSPSQTPTQEYEDNITTIIQTNNNDDNSNNEEEKEEIGEGDEDKLNISNISYNSVSSKILSPKNNQYMNSDTNNSDIDINSEKYKIWNDIFSVEREIKQIIIDLKLTILESKNEEDQLINLLTWLKQLSSNKDLLCRQAYNIFCALVESLLVKPELISIVKNKGIDSKKHLSFLIKFIFSKDELFKDREYDQLTRLIKKLESKGEYSKNDSSKWKLFIENKKKKMQMKSLLKTNKNVQVNISKSILMATEEYTIYKSCKVIELLCFDLKSSIEDVDELKDFLVVEMTAYEILQRICFNDIILSKDTAAVGTACLLISYKMCRVKYDIKAKYIHQILNHILKTYWKIIGNIDPTVEYNDNNNKNLYKLDLRYQSSILTKDSSAFDSFKTIVLEFEKTALSTIEYDFNQILPHNITGGTLYSHIDNLNLTELEIRNIQSIFTNKAYLFSSLCIFEDPNNILGACVIAARVRSSDDVTLFEKLNVDRKEVKRVNSYMHLFKNKLKEKFVPKLLLESTKINQFQIHALKVNKPIEKYKDENIKSGNKKDVQNPFLSSIYSLPTNMDNTSSKMHSSSSSSSSSIYDKYHDNKNNDRYRNNKNNDSRSSYRDSNRDNDSNRDRERNHDTRDRDRYDDNRDRDRYDDNRDRDRYDDKRDRDRYDDKRDTSDERRKDDRRNRYGDNKKDGDGDNRRNEGDYKKDRKRSRSDDHRDINYDRRKDDDYNRDRKRDSKRDSKRYESRDDSSCRKDDSKDNLIQNKSDNDSSKKNNVDKDIRLNH
jgi:hypothetical protein